MVTSGEKERETHTHRDRDTETERERDRDRQTDRDRERQRERDRQRETDRQRQADIQTDRNKQTDRQTDRERVLGGGVGVGDRGDVEFAHEWAFRKLLTFLLLRPLFSPVLLFRLFADWAQKNQVTYLFICSK